MQLAVLDWPLPGKGELETVLESCMANLPKEVENLLNGCREKVVCALSGLTAFEVSSVLSMAIAVNRTLNDGTNMILLDENEFIVMVTSNSPYPLPWYYGILEH